MRILVVQESNWLTRGPHQQHHLMERLRRLGHDIKVIDFEIDWRERKHYNPVSRTETHRAQSKVLDGEVIEVVRPAIIRAPVLSYASILASHTVWIIKLVKSFRPDVIIGLGLLNAYISARIAHLFQIPFVYYLIDSLHTLLPEKHLRPLGRLVESRALKIADKILVLNRRLGQYARNLGASETPEIVAAGIDRTRFNSRIDGKKVRKMLDIRENEKVIFFMGWLYDFSGLREVAATISKDDSNTRLLVLGKGELQEELRNIAAESHGNAITIIDWVPYDDVPWYISAADVCILPAHSNEIMRDIVPIKLYEYLACGKPVIATKLPGVMNEFGRNSGIVYVNQPSEVYESAKAICDDEERYKELSDLAEKCCKSLDWDQTTNSLLRILQSLTSDVI